MKNNLCNLTKRADADALGQVMIEFALVLPALVILLLGTIDLARAVYAYGVISNAARDGAHWGSLRPTLPIANSDDKDHGDLDKAAVRDKALSNTKTLNQSDVIPHADCAENDNNFYYTKYTDPTDKETHLCDSWNFVVVSVDYYFHPISWPITWLYEKIKLTAVSTMTIE